MLSVFTTSHQALSSLNAELTQMLSQASNSLQMINNWSAPVEMALLLFGTSSSEEKLFNIKKNLALYTSIFKLKYLSYTQALGFWGFGEIGRAHV